MYNVSYFYVEMDFCKDYGVEKIESSIPFKYGYDLSIIYASFNDHKRVLDYDNRIVINQMEESSEKYDPRAQGEFTGTGLLKKTEKINWKEYNTYISYGDYELRYEKTNIKFPATDGTYVWMSNVLEGLQKVDCIDLKTGCDIWSWVDESYEPLRLEVPLKIAGVLIHNLGYEDSSNLKGYVENFNGAMVGLDLKTGHELWRTTFEYMVANYIDVDGRLILSTMGYLVELDPVTGKELKRVDTHFSEAHLQGRKDWIAVYDIEDALLFISSADKKLSIHDRHTLEQRQVVNLPDSPASYGVDAKHKPIRFKDTWNLKVGAGYQNADRPSNDMLMQITLCQPGEQPSTNIEEKPPYQVTVIEEKEGQESYRIDLEARTPDHLIRLAEVEVALIPGNHGNTMWGAPDKNPKFNGKIAFYGTLPSEISPAELNRAKGYLRLLVQHWERVAEGDMGPYGSIPGTYIELSCFLNGEKI